jgi:hypothetical protein
MVQLLMPRLAIVAVFKVIADSKSRAISLSLAISISGFLEIKVGFPESS